MSFIHYLFLGYFEHEGEVVRFSKTPDDPVYRPVICRPLAIEAIQAVLGEIGRTEVNPLLFPDDWTMWLDEGYLICDKYLRNREAIHFISRLVERTHCDIVEAQGHCVITLHDWQAVRDRLPKALATDSPTA